MPRISVILPAYNAEEHLEEAVQSILNQTFTDFELIVINDASTDRTLQVLNSFTDSRLRIITNRENLKVVRSLNKGLEVAQGDFVARMDADDISLPKRLEAQVRFLDNNPDIDVCATWVQTFGNKEKFFFAPEDHDDIKAALLFHNVITHPTIMFRKTSLTKHNIKYDEVFVNAEDYGLWINVIDKLRFATIPQILLKYRVHESNISVLSNKADNDTIVKMNFEVYRRFLNKMGAVYNDDQLKLHFMVGFRQIKKLSADQIQQYLNWFHLLALANKRSKYFKHTSFQNEIIKNVVYLFTKAEKKPATILKFVKTFSKLYSAGDYIRFLGVRLKRSSKYKRRISQLETPFISKPEVAGSIYYLDRL